MIRRLVEEYAGKCDYVDVRVHELSKETILLENGETSNIFLNNKSFGVRTLYKGGWGMCFSHDFDKAKEVFEKTILAQDDMVIRIPLDDGKKFKIEYL